MNRVVAVLSMAAGVVFGAACIAVAAYEFYAPAWKVVAIKDGSAAITKGHMAAIRCSIPNMPPIQGMKTTADKWFGSGAEDKTIKSGSSAPGATSGTAGPGQFVIVRTPDSYSPKLADMCARSLHTDEIVLVASRAGIKGPGVRYDLHNVSIIGITLQAANAPGRQAGEAVSMNTPVEEVALQYDKIEWTLNSTAATGFLK